MTANKLDLSLGVWIQEFFKYCMNFLVSVSVLVCSLCLEFPPFHLSLWKSHAHSRFSSNANCSMKPSLRSPTRYHGFRILAQRTWKRSHLVFQTPQYSGPLLSGGYLCPDFIHPFWACELKMRQRVYTLPNQMWIVKEQLLNKWYVYSFKEWLF